MGSGTEQGHHRLVPKFRSPGKPRMRACAFATEHKLKTQRQMSDAASPFKITYECLLITDNLLK